MSEFSLQRWHIKQAQVQCIVFVSVIVVISCLNIMLVTMFVSTVSRSIDVYLTYV